MRGSYVAGATLTGVVGILFMWDDKMKLFNHVSGAFLALGVLAGGASAGTVGVYGSGNGYNTNIVGLYNSEVTPNSHSASLIDTITSATIGGLDLLWLLQPGSPYSAGQLTALNGYIDAGGRIAFLGEHGNFTPAQNNNINAALTALGSTMAIVNELLDGGAHDATRANGQILDDPLTAGVNTYNYAAFAPLTVGHGVNLMYGSDLTSSMMAFENVRAGSIFLITDQNVFDNVYSTSANDNGILFDNLVVGDTQNPEAPSTSTVPLPAAGWLLLAGVGGLTALRRRKAAA